jgi:hypothetical protein
VSDQPELGPAHRIVLLVEPPTEWCTWWTDLTRLTDEIYYGWPESEGTPNPWFWHRCTRREIWCAQSTDAHTLVSRSPLHLEPSLLWPCCDTHGWVRAGVWTSA